ncbi:MAG: HAD family phosphatase [Candidatus Altiarchaeota archaeon]
MKAAIFDLDGTLIDLFEVHLRAFKELVRKHSGLEFTREDLVAGYGLRGEEIVESFLGKNEVHDVDVGELTKERVSLAEKGAGEALVLPGVLELLAKLKSGGVRLAVGTSARRSMTIRVLEAAGLAGFFDAVVAIDDVSRGKPAPDIFLKAAGKLGVAPADCVVFEDSPYGIRAAKAAGMKSVAVLHGSQTPDELEKSKADLTLKSLENASLEALESLL